MSVAPSSAVSKPWYREIWPWLLMLPPAFAVAGGVAMIYLAASAPTALVVADYAHIEALTRERFARDRQAAALGVAARLTFARLPSRIEIELVAPPTALPPTLILNARHATNPAADRVLTLVPDDGRYVALAELAPGSYGLELLPADGSWRLGQDAARPSGSLELRPQAEPGAAAAVRQ